MVTVALVGASTGFGLTMLHCFLRENINKHKFVILSRSAKSELSALNIEVRPIDYNNHGQLVQALHGVHTVLSTIGGYGMRDAQMALIPAMQEAGVKRFAPSEYAGNGYEGVDLYAGKAEVWEATRKCGLEFTRFSTGLFINILATGTPKPVTDIGKQEGCKSGGQEALAHLRPWNYVVNMKNGTADLPADGNTQLCWTEMRDVSRFVYRALDLEKWPEELGMRGDVKSFKDIAEIAERVQGRKWLTKSNTIEEMTMQQDSPGKKFYNQTRIAFVKGWGTVGDELNTLFPDVEPTTCEEFIDKWWSGVELGEATWGEDQSFM